MMKCPATDDARTPHVPTGSLRDVDGNMPVDLKIEKANSTWLSRHHSLGYNTIWVLSRK
jgi:hypothetical protein